MRILITSGSGLLGSNVLRVARERLGADTFALLHRRALPDGLTHAQEPADLGDPSALAEQLARLRPDVVIHSSYLNDLRPSPSSPPISSPSHPPRR